MIKYKELQKALSDYTQIDIHKTIPLDYYQRVIKACFRANNNGLNWDIKHAASILIYLAFNEGHISPAQLNAHGLSSLDWAEKLLAQVPDTTHEKIIAALQYAETP